MIKLTFIYQVPNYYQYATLYAKKICLLLSVSLCLKLIIKSPLYILKCIYSIDPCWFFSGIKFQDFTVERAETELFKLTFNEKKLVF